MKKFITLTLVLALAVATVSAESIYVGRLTHVEFYNYGVKIADYSNVTITLERKKENVGNGWVVESMLYHIVGTGINDTIIKTDAVVIKATR
jgi:hypothetical protein